MNPFPVATLLMASFPTLLFANAQYSATPLFYPYGGSGDALAINNSGTIIDNVINPLISGVPFTTNTFALVRGASVQLINPPSGQIFIPISINDSDAIVGTAITAPPSNPVYSAVLYTDGNTATLPNPYASAGSTNCQATGINNSNQVVGNVVDASGQSHAVEWLFSGADAISLATANESSQASSINDAGVVAGFVSDPSAPYDLPVIWERGGAVQYLNLPTGAGGANTIEINNNNQVLCEGYFPLPNTDSPREQYYIWDNGKITLLGVIDGQTSAVDPSGITQAEHMNDAGTVVGTSDGRAVIWQGGEITDLNTLIDPDSGWTLLDASSINDAGDIVGAGEYEGQEEGFLLTPTGTISIPEPAAIPLAAGFCVLTARRRAKASS